MQTLNSGLYPGAHLAVSRGVYSHHGIYAGDSFVVHRHFGPVRLDTLAFFSRGRKLHLVPPEDGDFPPDEILARAMSLLGQGGYHPLSRNCEHFVTWCRTGRAESPQVKVGLAAAGIGLIARQAFAFHPVTAVGAAVVFGIGTYMLLGDEARKRALGDGLRTARQLVRGLRRVAKADGPAEEERPAA